MNKPMTARVRACLAGWFLLHGAPSIVTGQVRLAGSVTAIEGTPLAGAEVALFGPELPFDAGRRALARGAEAQPEPLARALTDATGTYAVAAPTVGIWRLRVSAAGRSAVERFVLVDRAGTLPVAILPERRPTPVTVLRRDGSAVPAADLRGLRLESNWIYTPMGWGFTPQTLVFGPHGEPLLDAWPDSGWSEVAAYLPGTGELGLLPSSHGLRFLAFDAVQQPIVVRDAHRRPVAGAVVRQGQLPCGADLTGKWTSGIGRGIEITWTVGTTDATGRLGVPLPPGCAVTLTAYAADGAEGSVEVKLRDKAREGVAAIDLVGPRTVTGHVVDPTSGAAVGDALVYSDGAPTGWALSAPDGTVTLRLAPPDVDRWRLVVQRQGFFPSSVELERGSPALRRPLVLPLSPMRWLRGRVVGPDGLPIVGAALVIDPLGADPATAEPQRFERVESDAEGAFALPLRDGMRYGLRLLHEEYATRLLTIGAGTEAPIGSSPRFLLDRGRTGVGRVIDPSGRPIAGAEILCDIDEPPPADEGEVRLFEGVRATSAADGRFRLEKLGVRPYVLSVRAPGRMAAERHGIQPQAGEGMLDLGDVVLEPPAH